MLRFKTLTIKNFMSCGNSTQTVDLENGLTLILGNNLDGGEAARNGTGKSTLCRAIEWVLFDKCDIRKDNLVNKTNAKDMLVTLRFEKAGIEYEVHRGRRKNVFRLLVAGKELTPDNNDAQGEMHDTQKHLESIVGISYELFRQIVFIDTFWQPFLLQRDKDQKQVIEELLRVTKISEKAAVLKDAIRQTTQAIKSEEMGVAAIKRANEQILKSISEFEVKSQMFEADKSASIQTIGSRLDVLRELALDEEFMLHDILAEKKRIEAELKRLKPAMASNRRHIENLTRNFDDVSAHLMVADAKTCPMCSQELSNHETLLAELAVRHDELTGELRKAVERADELEGEYDSFKSQYEMVRPLATPIYESVEQAYNHKAEIDRLESSLAELVERANPFDSQIVALRESAVQDVDLEPLTHLTRYKEHQEFLYRLLTSNDSYVRKSIISQNLSYLNGRLAHYLEKMGLAHDVQFMEDMDVTIGLLGQDYDFGNLSRGERQRLILSLSWAMRDLWEMTEFPINLFLLDEVLDSGIDSAGLDASMEILKGFSRDRAKEVFIISHREELVARIPTVLHAVKDGGFTTYSKDT